MKIVITGSSSHLAKVLLPALCEHSSVQEVIGMDIRPGVFKHEKYSFLKKDIRDKNICEDIKNCDAVIHTAFVVLRSSLGQQRKNRQLAKSVNIDGSINVFNAALKNNIKCLIHISSATVYGAFDGNPAKISEDHPRKVMQGFSYAEDKNTLEDWLDAHEDHVNTRLLRFRPHVILGPHAQPFLLQLIQQPYYPYFSNPQPQIQCTWENDVAEAVIKGIFSDAQGIYNIASPDTTSFKEIIQATHKLALPIPFLVAKTIQNIAWHFSSRLEEPGWIDGMKHSLVLDTSKLENEFHWQASRSSLQCAIDALSTQSNQSI